MHFMILTAMDGRFSHAVVVILGMGMLATTQAHTIACSSLQAACDSCCRLPAAGKAELRAKPYSAMHRACSVASFSAGGRPSATPTGVTSCRSQLMVCSSISKSPLHFDVLLYTDHVDIVLLLDPSHPLKDNLQRTPLLRKEAICCCLVCRLQHNALRKSVRR